MPTASLTAKGITQLSSATDSTSEVLAATPKAVKAAYDLANGKYTAQDATTAQKGIVQLSSDTNSTSETLAATPKAVKAAYDLAAGKAPSSHTHPWNQITGVPTASLTAKGITQLSSATDSTSEVLAATPKAVKAAYDLADGKYTAQDATTAQKGIVQLSSDTNSTSETLAATPKAVKAAYDLAAGKAPSSHTHPWNQITGVPTASLTAKGITQLSSATDSTSEVLAATPKAVKAAYDLADGKYTAQDATTTQKGIVQLSSDTDSESETEAATPKAVKAIKAALDKKQPLNDMLTALSKLMPAGNAFPYFDADKKISLASISEIARQFISLDTLYSMQEFLVTPDLIARRIRSHSATFEPDVGNVFLAAYMRPADDFTMTARGRMVDGRYLRDINIELKPDMKTLIFNVDDIGTSSFPGSYAALYGYIGAITGYEIGLFIRFA